MTIFKFQYAIYLSAILLTVLSLLFFQPRWLLASVEYFIPGVYYFVETNKPIIALTIDDIPNEQTTKLIFNILKQNEVKATFFVISNQVSGNEYLITEIVKNNHEIGNHLTEDKPSIKLSPEAFEQDLLKAEEVLLKYAPVQWMRPASGWYNKMMLDTAKKHGYRVALGSIFPYDTHISSSWFATQQISLNVRPGSIIVLHDGGSRGKRTAETLTKIIPRLKEKGYKFVTLSELVK